MQKRELKVYQADNFTVTVDASTRIEKDSPVEDFTIYRFVSPSGTYLSAYAGNQPRFPRIVGEEGKQTVVHIGDRDAKCVRSPTGYECLVELDPSIAFPRFVHFWYEQQSEAQTQLADSVISSFREPPPD